MKIKYFSRKKITCKTLVYYKTWSFFFIGFIYNGLFYECYCTIFINMFFNVAVNDSMTIILDKTDLFHRMKCHCRSLFVDAVLLQVYMSLPFAVLSLLRFCTLLEFQYRMRQNIRTIDHIWTKFHTIPYPLALFVVIVVSYTCMILLS